MGIFSNRSLTPAEKLQALIKDNPTHPFLLNYKQQFVHEVRYTRFYIGIVGFVLTVAMVIVFVEFDLVETSFFLWPVSALIMSLFSIIQYRQTRTYILDPHTKTYTFMLGDRVVCKSKFHNVYIRLRKRIDSGTPYYYLIFNGYRIDKLVLTAASRKYLDLRAVGQELAANLNINYFDEANVSDHHRVIHLRSQDDDMYY
eukprot:TRINITY_DN70105_c0_g1_i1.p1 TRINITY_DN70105_c0_g1~~TRINITY_DN70105_c0_g1_i1.p1  ORF type:complete len:200 (+),score=78.24 TRINITY_DN70105_c0_g1_i1:70-669(+)